VSFDTHEVHIVNTKNWTLIESMTHKVVTNDEAVTGSKFFLLFFGTLGKYVTNLRGTFVANVKMSKINPP
jgi:hypothetical protein